MIKDVDGVIDALVAFVRERVSLAGKSGCVVGLSGGIDSAVTARICQLAFPKELTVVFLPGETSSMDARDRARELSDAFGMGMKVVPVGDPVAGVLGGIADAFDLGGASAYVRGSTSSCMRAVVLDALAKMKDALIAGTGNKSEDDIGYFNVRGDGAVDFVLLADLYKAEVYQLAAHPRIGIPVRTIEAEPSAELWEGQTDEDELGVSYPMLETALRILDGEPIPIPDVPAEVLEHVAEMKQRNLFKLLPPTVCKLRCLGFTD